MLRKEGCECQHQQSKRSSQPGAIVSGMFDMTETNQAWRVST